MVLQHNKKVDQIWKKKSQMGRSNTFLKKNVLWSHAFFMIKQDKTGNKHKVNYIFVRLHVCLIWEKTDTTKRYLYLSSPAQIPLYDSTVYWFSVVRNELVDESVSVCQKCHINVVLASFFLSVCPKLINSFNSVLSTLAQLWLQFFKFDL